MEIIQVYKSKDLPETNCRAYTLNASFTVSDAEVMFEKRFKVKPAKAWQWVNILYIPEPEEKAKKNDN